MNLFININGKILAEGQAILSAVNRSYRYGDGLFETMKLVNGRIILEDYHFERLEISMQLLHIKKSPLFNKENIREEITSLCRKNKCGKLARIRLSVSRGNGGLYDSDNQFQYLIECCTLDEFVNNLNEQGLIIDIFPAARKSCDLFSNLKSANYLPYVMAALYAKEKKLNDCLLLNVHDRICDATIANLFWVKDGIVFTPPLSEGPVSGVMRRYLLNQFKNIQERVCKINDLENADEIFLTNAIRGMQWIKQFREKKYSCSQSGLLYTKYISPLLEIDRII